MFQLNVRCRSTRKTKEKVMKKQRKKVCVCVCGGGGGGGKGVRGIEGKKAITFAPLLFLVLLLFQIGSVMDLDAHKLF